MRTIKSFRQSKYFLPACFVVGFVLIGLITIMISRAIAPTAVIEPEDGTVGNGATVVTDPTASGGKAVRFKNAPLDNNLAPATGSLLGAQQSPSSLLATREQQFGRKYDIDHSYKPWNNGTLSLSSAQTDLQAGRIPLVSWDGPDLTTVTDGSYDAQIQASASAVKALPGKLFIRWCWEMNINVGAGKGVCGFDPNAHTTAEKQAAGAKFVAAWRHIHDIFKAQGDTNAVWVWCPDNQLGSGSLVNTGDAGGRWDYLYPGDAYVDWICVDGYNKTPTTWRSFQTMFNTFYNKYKTTGKPLMIGETSSIDWDSTNTNNKAQWITDMANTLQTTYPQIKALVWFDENKEENWLIDSLANPSSLAAYTTMAHKCYFNTRGSLPTCSP